MIKTCSCGKEFEAVNHRRTRCDECSRPKTWLIDGKPMTMEQIQAACPGISLSALRNRIYWGWDTIEKLRLPLKPGRFSPWRRGNFFLSRPNKEVAS